MPASTKPLTKEHALRQIRELEAMIAGLDEQQSAEGKALLERLQDEARRGRQEALAMVLALIADEPVPVSMYKEWLSYSALYAHERAGRIQMERIHGRACLKPSVFFEFWRKQRTDA